MVEEALQGSDSALGVLFQGQAVQEPGIKGRIEELFEALVKGRSCAARDVSSVSSRAQLHRARPLLANYGLIHTPLALAGVGATAGDGAAGAGMIHRAGYVQPSGR